MHPNRHFFRPKPPLADLLQPLSNSGIFRRHRRTPLPSLTRPWPLAPCAWLWRAASDFGASSPPARLPLHQLQGELFITPAGTPRCKSYAAVPSQPRPRPLHRRYPRPHHHADGIIPAFGFWPPPLHLLLFRLLLVMVASCQLCYSAVATLTRLDVLGR